MMRPSLVLITCRRLCNPASVKTVSVSLSAGHGQLRSLAYHANHHDWFPRKFASSAPTTTAVSTRSSSSSSSSSSGMDSERPPRRPFAVLGVQQIAIGCAERAPLHRLWTEIFGLEPTQTGITIASENVVEDILVVGRGKTAVEIDLMTPIDPEKSPKVKRQNDTRSTASWIALALALIAHGCTSFCSAFDVTVAYHRGLGSCSTIESHWLVGR
jgi:hypothetical protein